MEHVAGRDESFVTGRKDVARFTLPALDRDVTITGEVVADLFAATTGSDADWIVKLIDVYPDDPPASLQQANSPETLPIPPQRQARPRRMRAIN